MQRKKEGEKKTQEKGESSSLYKIRILVFNYLINCTDLFLRNEIFFDVHINKLNAIRKLF